MNIDIETILKQHHQQQTNGHSYFKTISSTTKKLAYLFLTQHHAQQTKEHSYFKTTS